MHEVSAGGVPDGQALKNPRLCARALKNLRDARVLDRAESAHSGRHDLHRLRL
jgi:hypothetical protein